jgi:hypothetical protein
VLITSKAFALNVRRSLPLDERSVPRRTPRLAGTAPYSEVEHLAHRDDQRVHLGESGGEMIALGLHFLDCESDIVCAH